MSLLPPDRIRHLRARHGRRMAKYLAGSVIATIVSACTFSVTFGLGVLGSKGASLTASSTGAVANYFLNRNWAWEKRGRADLRKELVPYWRTVVITAALAAVVTSLVNALLRDMQTARSWRTVINTLAFLGTYGVMFLVKYRVFDRLFGTEPRSVPPGPVTPVVILGTDPPRVTTGQPASGMASATTSPD